ncbi:MAG: hypothetical protein H0U72_00065 [Nitrosospira sp.]|nr:hypothetical protein [Nitrosospira sp.]
MIDKDWEEHIKALTNIILNLQQELRAVTDERDRLLEQIEKPTDTVKEVHERLWIPGETPE